MTNPSLQEVPAEETNYTKFRGKCKEFCEKAVLEDPTLRIVRGYYICPFWGRQEHWWTERPDSTVYDPTVLQFPSGSVPGLGEYEEFDGNSVCCSQCGKEGRIEDYEVDGNYCFCSGACHYRFVM